VDECKPLPRALARLVHTNAEGLKTPVEKPSNEKKVAHFPFRTL
jgi:hypothetical protein